MSDTPRTDAVWEKFETDLRGELEPDVEFSTLARQLERELNAANEMFRKLNIHALNLTDRIKRLEEGGDKGILNSYLPDRLAVWNKAKEDKL
jgi:hypothetical protein